MGAERWPGLRRSAEVFSGGSDASRPRLPEAATVRRRILRATLAIGLIFGAAAAFAYSTGPPISRTGAPAIGGKPAEGLCTMCHDLSFANDGTGKVEILDLPASYVPGQVYPLRVRLSSTANQEYPDRK